MQLIADGSLSLFFGLWQFHQGCLPGLKRIMVQGKSVYSDILYMGMEKGEANTVERIQSFSKCGSFDFCKSAF